MYAHRIVPILLAGLVLVTALPALAGQTGWLLRQADLEVARLTGELPADTRDFQSDFGGGGEITESSGGKSPAIPMLMSMVLPGAGELYLGHKRGFLMIALDAAAWYGGINASKQGDEKSDEYYAYADEHWFEDKLDAGYDPNWSDLQPNWNPDYDYMGKVGIEYFNVSGYQNLPLWVSKEDDRREYYENLGKWDQFVFGWDDFEDPRVFLDLDSQDIDIANLQDPRTSQNRETYRAMRKEANDAYARQDRFLYLNIGLRVFSVLQVAYLEGLLFGDGGGGGEDASLEVGGHQVDFTVAPVGFSRGIVGATISF